jgi:para-nitrobenzyl esterase
MWSPQKVFVAIGILAAASAAFAATEAVKIDSGRLKGVNRDGVVAFKGIPFAAPPVGDFRWRPPQPVKPWTAVRVGQADPWKTRMDLIEALASQKK